MEEIKKNIKQSIQSLEPKAEVILFGSQARGDAQSESDWDVLILLPYPSDIRVEQRFRHKMLELEISFGIAISTFVYAKDEWTSKHSVTPLYKNVSADGILL